MSEPAPRRRQRPAIEAARAEALLAEVAQRMAAEVDGLRVDPVTGEFHRRGLIPGWVVEGAVAAGSGALELTRLAVRPESDDAGRVTARLLRSIPVAALLDEIRRRLVLADAATRSAQLAVYGQPPAGDPLEVADRPRRGRLTDATKQKLLRRLAIAYLDEAGHPGMYARLARRLRRDPDSIKALVRAARADGWLAGAEHGMRGASPGPRLLADEEFQQLVKGADL